MARPLVRDEDGLSTLWSFVLVVILVAAILGVYYGVVVPKFGPPPIRSQSGDEVKVDYTGTFAGDNLVFDTSLLAVANDNATQPKAFSFSWHPSWQPLGVTIGAGTVVAGFDQGISGLVVGESKLFAVPPSLGYGPADPAKVFVKPLFESVPVRITMNATDYLTTYHTAAVSGSNISDPFWGWNAYVSVAGTVVTVTNSPTPGQIVRPYGAWNAVVVSIDDAANGGVGVITVQHRLDPSMVDRIGLKDSSGKVTFVVTAVDPVAGTYTLNYNDPTKGRTLVFHVTMVSIVRPF